jgi:hypothetical protein
MDDKHNYFLDLNHVKQQREQENSARDHPRVIIFKDYFQDEYRELERKHLMPNNNKNNDRDRIRIFEFVCL